MNKKTSGAAMVIVGVVCVIASEVMSGDDAPTGATPWAQLYDESGVVIGGPRSLPVVVVPANAPAASPSVSTPPAEWNPTPDELYGSE